MQPPVPSPAMAPQLTALIMAAGHGTRMRSSLPKVLHEVCGVPMVHWVIDAARDAGADRVVCITRAGEGVAEELPPDRAEAVDQAEGEGTGSAVLAAREGLEQSDRVVVLSGDVPLTTAATIEGLLEAHEREQAAATLLTTEELDPTSYGRIVRDDEGHVQRIVETKSTEGVPAEVLEIREINIGTYVFDGPALAAALQEAQVEDNGERYLTSVFPILLEKGLTVAAHPTGDTLTAMGVNNRADLTEVTRHAQRRILREHATAGVTFSAPDTVAVDKGVTIGEDTIVTAGVTLRGATSLGARCEVGPATTITDSEIGDGVTI